MEDEIIALFISISPFLRQEHESFSPYFAVFIEGKMVGTAATLIVLMIFIDLLVNMSF